MTTHAAPSFNALIVLPRLKVINANCSGGDITWGFPAITNFSGQMIAMERRLGVAYGLKLNGIGIVCHDFQTKTYGEYVQRFYQQRAPLDKDGSTKGIVESGYIDIEVSLVYAVQADEALLKLSEEEHADVAAEVYQAVQEMRLAGGSVIHRRSHIKPQLVVLSDDSETRESQFRRVKRQLLPGFALIGRDDLLQEHFIELQASNPEATQLDALVDKVRVNHWSETDEAGETTWRHSKPEGSGWIVPLAVGYGGLSKLYAPGEMAGVRRNDVDVRIVECVYSLGEWLSPHRMTDMSELFWYPSYDPEKALYRCNNAYMSAARPILPTSAR